MCSILRRRSDKGTSAASLQGRTIAQVVHPPSDDATEIEMNIHSLAASDDLSSQPTSFCLPACLSFFPSMPFRAQLQLCRCLPRSIEKQFTSSVSFLSRMFCNFFISRSLPLPSFSITIFSWDLETPQRVGCLQKRGS